MSLAAAPALAATPAATPFEDPEATVLSELVVRARLPGPAWWKVERGGSVVFILGLPGEPLPKGQVWDQSVLQRRLAGANALIMPVKVSAGLGDIPALLRLRAKLQRKTPMEEGLPETLRARFAAARTRLGQPARRYASWDALFAGQMLVYDFQHAIQARSNEPVSTIVAAARRLRVPVRPAGSFRAVGVLNPAVDNLTQAISEHCLVDALDEVERGETGLKAAGQAWAQGDIPGVLAGPRGFTSCLLLLSGGAGFWRQVIGQEVEAVSKALERPGQTVVILPLRSVIAEDGVLSRLRRSGLEVSGEGPAPP